MFPGSHPVREMKLSSTPALEKSLDLSLIGSVEAMGSATVAVGLGWMRHTAPFSLVISEFSSGLE